MCVCVCVHARACVRVCACVCFGGACGVCGWEDVIRNDMKKLKIKNWTSCIQDRSKWKLYVEKDKMFKD
jgi:hypothetical protein